MKRSHRMVAVMVACIAMPAGSIGQPAPTGYPGAGVRGDSALEARTTAVASTLRCPVCQGESIQESPSTLAQQMRAVVRDKLRNGESPEQVKAYFVARYGEWILLEPKMTGLNIVLYVLPVVLILGGIGVVVMLVRRWTKTPEPEATE